MQSLGGMIDERVQEILKKINNQIEINTKLLVSMIVDQSRQIKELDEKTKSLENQLSKLKRTAAKRKSKNASHKQNSTS